MRTHSSVEEVCSISQESFVIPPGYKRLGLNRGRALVDEEEELLQLAIQQSLLEQGGGAEQVSLWVDASGCGLFGALHDRCLAAGYLLLEHGHCFVSSDVTAGHPV